MSDSPPKPHGARTDNAIDDIAPRLVPRSIQILRWIKECDQSMDAMMLAHPDVTAAEVMAAAQDIMRAIMLPEPPRGKRGKAGRKRGNGAKLKPAASGNAFQLKITLRDTKPPIWRRVIVPAEITFDRLHDVIQLTMGWIDSHLHSFETAKLRFEPPAPYGEDYGVESLDEADHRLCNIVTRPKQRIRYQYDFGDNWNHDIVVEKVIPAAEKPAMMTCVAGKMRCPPEDCGGTWGYYDKLAILADPNHEEHEDIKGWIGEEFDPAEFDVADANAALADLRSRYLSS